MSKPICISFAGVPGCGKTPVAHYLSCELGLPIISNDAMRSEVLVDTLNSEIDLGMYREKRDERINRLVGTKRSFIYDASVDREWFQYRPRLMSAGYQWFLISFDLSGELLAAMARATGYVQSPDVMSMRNIEHQKFVASFSADIGCTISDENFIDRMNLALASLRKGIKGL